MTALNQPVPGHTEALAEVVTEPTVLQGQEALAPPGAPAESPAVAPASSSPAFDRATEAFKARRSDGAPASSTSFDRATAAFKARRGSGS